MPSFAALLAREADASARWFMYHRAGGRRAEVFVVGRMFAWDEQSPVVWIDNLEQRHMLE